MEGRHTQPVIASATPIDAGDAPDQRAPRGGPQAFGELIADAQERIVTLCWRMCGNRHDAEDLAQEAFVKAFRAMETFDGRAAFSTWLYRIAVNVCLSARRRPRLRSASVGDDLSDLGAAGRAARHPGAPEPLQRAADREMHQRVVDALDTLDDEHRAVILLRDMEGLDYRRIAQVLGVRVGTVKSRLHRARSALREKLLPTLGTMENT
jgi:RNA polymerase sigma-70 factor (ECF subfamily)